MTTTLTPTSPTLRVLVTGSRAWPDPDTVETALDAQHAAAARAGMTVTVVHGDCRTGADAYALAHAARNRWAREAWPARWDRYGLAAGPIRARAMAASGIDVCLAFPWGESRGTRGTMAAARRAGALVLLPAGDRAWPARQLVGAAPPTTD